MNFHFQVIFNGIFFIYDTFTFSIYNQHAVSNTLYATMCNKNFQNEKSDEHDENKIINEKSPEKHDENEYFVSGGMQ